MKANERAIHEAIVKYLRAQYSGVFFHTDLAGENMTMGQAVKAQKVAGQNGFPDLVIYAVRPYCDQRGDNPGDTPLKSGLALEVKVDSPYLERGPQKGMLRSQMRHRKQRGIVVESWNHLEAQDKWHQVMRASGFVAEFVVGFDEARALIDKYLNA